MNPWQSLRREIDGALRSIRDDLSARRVRHVRRQDTVPLPAEGQRPPGDRRRLYTVAAAVSLLVGGVSG